MALLSYQATAKVQSESGLVVHGKKESNINSTDQQFLNGFI